MTIEVRVPTLGESVTEATVATLEPIQTKYAELMDDRTSLRDVLQKSADRIRPLAEETVHLAKQRVGLYTG